MVPTRGGSYRSAGQFASIRSTEDLLTRCRVERVGSAEHGTAGLDCVQALPNHADNGTRGHVLDETLEEGLANVLGVVCIQQNA